MLLSNLLSFMKVFGYSFFQNFSENTPCNADHIGELLYKVLPVALRLKDCYMHFARGQQDGAASSAASRLSWEVRQGEDQQGKRVGTDFQQRQGTLTVWRSLLQAGMSQSAAAELYKELLQSQ